VLNAVYDVTSSRGDEHHPKLHRSALVERGRDLEHQACVRGSSACDAMSGPWREPSAWTQTSRWGRARRVPVLHRQLRIPAQCHPERATRVAAGAAVAVLAAIEGAIDVPRAGADAISIASSARAELRRGQWCGRMWDDGCGDRFGSRPVVVRSKANLGGEHRAAAADLGGDRPGPRAAAPAALVVVGVADHQEGSEQAFITTTLQQALAAAERDGFATAGFLRRVDQRRVPGTPSQLCFPPRRAQTRSRTSPVRCLRRAHSDASLTSPTTVMARVRES